VSRFVQNKFPAFRELPEPLLAFGERNGAHGIGGHPLTGLVAHGPFSLTLFESYAGALRIAQIAPHDEPMVAKRLVAELQRKHVPGERRDYLIEYPGFKDVFGVDLSAGSADLSFPLPANLDDELQQADDPRLVLTSRLDEALSAAAKQRGSFDVVVVRLPERWRPWFFGEDEHDDFDLHDYIKATGAQLGIATQIIRDNALQYKDRCSVAWRLGIAFYTKAGGVPWKLADTTPSTMFVGIGYALRGSGTRRFAIGAAQVFDSTGVGLEFVGYTAAEEDGTRIDGRHPYLTRRQMQALLGRAVALYQRQHAGRLPRRVVVHKSTEFKPLETEGAFDALGRIGDVELLQIQQDTRWRGVRGTREQTADSWPIHRGTLVHLSGTELLLWTQGNAPSVARAGGNFYKEGRGVPHPVVLRRWAGHASAEEVASEVLALTKMDWNNDSLYNDLPVTLAYAADLARTLKRLRESPTDAIPFRWFM
jgi:hypothetical protein